MNSRERENSHLFLGEIVGVHGVKGELKAYFYSGTTPYYLPGNKIRLSQGSSEKEISFEIKRIRPHKRINLLFLKGIDSREKAESLVGAKIIIKRENLPEPEEDSYYWADIIGLTVYTIDNERVGRIESIISTGSNDVYVVQDDKKDRKKTETLIPAIESVICEVNLKEKRMRVVIPQGL